MENSEIGLNDLEHHLRTNGYNFICGIDEAGRGTLAGPVVVGALILNNKIDDLRDSKLLTHKKREELFKVIQDEAISYAVGIIDHNRIDKINILNATKEGVVQAIGRLKIKPDFVLLDALNIKGLDIPQKGIIKGDRYINVISGASIVAKVIRDRIMIYYDLLYPQYNFKKHKGYGTKEHIKAIKKYGPCPIHRKSFKPISQILQGGLFDDNEGNRE